MLKILVVEDSPPTASMLVDTLGKVDDVEAALTQSEAPAATPVAQPAIQPTNAPLAQPKTNASPATDLLNQILRPKK